VSVDALHHSGQRRASGGYLSTRRQSNVSHYISPSECCFNVSEHYVSLLFQSITLVLWSPLTIHRYVFIGYTLASGLQYDGCCCEYLSLHPFYLRAKCNSLFTNYTLHSKSPDLCGYWPSIDHSVRDLSYYQFLSLEIRAGSRNYCPH
jgi:hypothetical protein